MDTKCIKYCTTTKDLVVKLIPDLFQKFNRHYSKKGGEKSLCNIEPCVIFTLIRCDGSWFFGTKISFIVTQIGQAVTFAQLMNKAASALNSK